MCLCSVRLINWNLSLMSQLLLSGACVRVYVYCVHAKCDMIYLFSNSCCGEQRRTEPTRTGGVRVRVTHAKRKRSICQIGDTIHTYLHDFRIFTCPLILLVFCFNFFTNYTHFQREKSTRTHMPTFTQPFCNGCYWWCVCFCIYL